MKRFWQAAALVLSVALVSLTAPVHAAAAKSDKVDMAKVTCKDVAAKGKDEMAMMLFWIDGYLSKEKNDTVLTGEWIQELGEMIKTACSKNATKPLLKLVREQLK